MTKLYQKLLALQKAVVGLTKDARGNAADYVSGNKLLSIVRPKMDELGLLLQMEITDCKFTRQEYNTAKGPKAEMFCELKLQFTWIDVESGESLPCEWASSGMNAFDKSLGSAVTYAERYFLLKQLHVATDRDDVDAPKSAEAEMSLQNAIGYINGLTKIEDMQKAWSYYQQWYAKDKEFVKAYNQRMKIINHADGAFPQQ